MKKILKITLLVVLALAVLAGGYFVYLLASYSRIPDEQALAVQGDADVQAEPGAAYTIVSWNIGFGAYEADYSFFMDGGTESWAWSRERLTANMDAISEKLGVMNADFYILQEVDTGSTRTYGLNEREILQTALEGRDSAFAVNYHSSFLFYPLTQPHGASNSGILTASDFDIADSMRRSLPVEDSLMKFMDLDRCYSLSRIPVSNGKTLCLYNVHLSAYTSDGIIADQQLALLAADMQAEYDAGNYVVCGGDFNKDLLGNSGEVFGVSTEGYTWAQPLPVHAFDGTNLQLVAPLDAANPVASCRNADAPYHEGQLLLTVDGFVVSENVQVSAAAVVDNQFANSDHNPVTMTFTLLGETG